MPLHLDTVSVLQTLKDKGATDKKIVFISGTFNIVHPGHLRLLRFAAECGEFLLVGVLNDQLATNSQLNQAMRLDGVSAISWVGHGFVLNHAPAEFIAALKPAVVVKGIEHESNFNPELKAVESYGGKLIFGSGELSFSSLDLLKREMVESNLSSIIRTMDFPRRHSFNLHDLRNTV